MPKPVIVLNANAFSEMGLTNANESVDFGTASGTAINLTNNTHNLGAGLSVGSVNVYSGIGTDSIVYALDIGASSTYTATDGTLYKPEGSYNSGTLITTANAIANTTDDVLYQTTRKTQSKIYSFPVSTGYYELLLKFGNADGSTGDRMDLKIEEKTVRSSFSVFSTVGSYAALDLSYNLFITDGAITVEFGRIANDDNQLAAVRIKKVKTPSINFGKPSSSAISVASVVGNTNQKVVFGYEANAPLIGYAGDSIKAKQRRVGLYIDRLGPDYWTADGQALFANAMCWCNYNCPSPLTITTGAITSPYCPGQPFTLSYTLGGGSFTAGNKFVVQLSNAYGSFANFTEIGSIKAIGSGTIQCKIPEPILAGSQYQIRVIGSLPTQLGTSTGAFTITSSAPKPGPIKGNQYACKYQSVQTYSVDSVAGMRYLWEIPLGTHFVKPSAANKIAIVAGKSVTIDFGTATTSAITVRTVTNCDTSDEVNGISSLLVYMTEYPPAKPNAISGKSSVCQAYEGDYVISLVANAVKYGWIIPAAISKVGVDSNNVLRLNFSGTNDLTNYTIKGYAIGDCGNSDTVLLVIRVDNAANKPVVGTIKITPSSCPGEYIYSVTPLQGAISYNWILPAQATGVSNTNEIFVTYTAAYTGTISLIITDNCGTSNPSVIPVSVSTSGKTAMLYVANSSALTTHELSIRTRLQDSLFYTVGLMDNNDTWGGAALCYDVIVVAGTIANNVRTEVKNVGIPLVSFSDDANDGGAFRSLGMESISSYNAENRVGKNTVTQINIINNSHVITSGLPLGNVTVYKASRSAVWSEAHPNAIDLARSSNTVANAFYKPVDSAYIFCFEKNILMWNSFNAPARRVGLFIDKGVNMSIDMTKAGLKIFDMAVCWATNSCFLCPSTLVGASTITHVNCNSASTGAIQISPANGLAPYSYSWSNGKTTKDISVISAATYRLTITDSKACTSSAVFVVSQASALVIGGSKVDLNCNAASTGTIDIAITGGSTPFSFSWNTGSVNEDQNSLSAGTYNVTVSDTKACLITSSYTLTQPLAINVSTAINHISCSGGSDGSIAVTVSGGNTPYTYSWGTGATSNSISDLTQSAYMFSVRDSKSCQYSNSYSITQSTPLVVTGISTAVSAAGGSNGAITTTPSGGSLPYTYSWTNGKTTQDLSNLIAGDYTISLTDTKMCTTTATWSIGEPGLITLTGVLLHPSCNSSSDGSIQLSVSHGVTPYQYSWSNAKTSDLINGQVAGLYSVTVTDATAATKTASFTITQPNIMTIVKNPIPASCHSLANGVIDITVSGGMPSYTYQWSNLATTQDVTNLKAGTYTITISDTRACKLTSSAIVTQPDSIQINDSVFSPSCFGNSNGGILLSVTGGVLPYIYNWSNGRTVEDLSNISYGTYMLNLRDSKLCLVTKIFSVSQPADLVIVPLITPTSCFGKNDASIQVVASGGTTPYSYLWVDGHSASQHLDLVAGNYKISITDKKLCSTSASFDIIETDSIMVTETITPSACGNASGSIMLSGGVYNYAWSNGQTNSTTTELNSGEIYTVRVSTAFDCYKEFSYEMSGVPALVIDTIEIIRPYCSEINDGVIELSISGGSGNASYAWTNGKKDLRIENLREGNYTLLVQDEACNLEASVKLTNLKSACIMIPTVFSPNDDGFNDRWEFFSDKNNQRQISLQSIYPNLTVEVYNRMGMSVFKSEKGYPKAWDGKLNGLSLPIDSYHFIINLGNGEKQMIGQITILK